MSFLVRVFRKDLRKNKSATPSAAEEAPPPPPRWEDSWERTSVEPEEVDELIHECTSEVKSRGLEMPMFLLPFRPNVDTSAAKHTVRNYFRTRIEADGLWSGSALRHQLKLTDPPALCSVLKWCWSRLRGGIVTWDAYELFKIGESDSQFALHAFDTFIPISVQSAARRRIIIDFFDLLAATAARSKSNGLGGIRLPRMAAWWAFELSDSGKGFDGGYKSWLAAADACAHLFFAYLRSLSSNNEAARVISVLPLSLQALLNQTEYPPETPTLLQVTTSKVVMIVQSVSPTPYSLLRRAKHFEYRDQDRGLQQFSSYADPVKALTDECSRVLQCISSANESTMFVEEGIEASWTRFEHIGFSVDIDSTQASLDSTQPKISNTSKSALQDGRPTTPSWADFLSTGFEENKNVRVSLYPGVERLPPIRSHSSQSHKREDDLDPGELASIVQFDLDDTFWWVWMVSLASEETADRKAIFGRCALIETTIPSSRWLVIEEQLRGASPDQDEGAVVVSKRSRFGFTRRGRHPKSKKSQLISKPPEPPLAPSDAAKAAIHPEKQAAVQLAAAKIRQQKALPKTHEEDEKQPAGQSRYSQNRTNSVFTLPAGDYALPAALTWAAGDLPDVPEDSSSGAEDSRMRYAPRRSNTSSRLPPIPDEGNARTTTPTPSQGLFASSGKQSEPLTPALSTKNKPETPTLSNTNNNSPKNDQTEKRNSPGGRKPLFSKRASPEAPIISNPVPKAETSVALAQLKTIPVQPQSATPARSTPINPSHASARKPSVGSEIPQSQTVSARTPSGQSQNSTNGNSVIPPRTHSRPSPPRPSAVKADGGRLPSSVIRKPVPAPEIALAGRPKPVAQTVQNMQNSLLNGNSNGVSSSPLSRSSPPHDKTTQRNGRAPEAKPAAAAMPLAERPVNVSSNNSKPAVPMDRKISAVERSKFTAGPLPDMPAFIPDDDDDDVTPSLTPHGRRSLAPVPESQPQPPPTPPFVRDLNLGQVPLLSKNKSIPSLQMPSIQVEEPSESSPGSAVSPPPRAPRPIPLSQRLPIKPSPASGPVPNHHAHQYSQHQQQQHQQQQQQLSQSTQQGAALSNDRWAQIRKNAQERAARLNEEQRARTRAAAAAGGPYGGAAASSPLAQASSTPRSGGSSGEDDYDETDEDDDNDEETIESRVARIKARVAELTGNIDATANMTALSRTSEYHDSTNLMSMSRLSEYHD